MVPASAKDAYRILGISEGASPDEIKNAYRITALKWHPDRHHGRYDKEIATRYFTEATNAYRTLVREGHLKYRQVPVVNNIPESHPVQRPPLMTQQSSSHSSLSLDSFIHLVASSTESLTTPSSSNRESPSSSRKQGIRIPSETIASQYRNTAPPVSDFHYESPQRGVKGPAMYKPIPVAQLHNQKERPKAPKSPPIKQEGGMHQRIPPLQTPGLPSVNHHDFRQSQDHPRVILRNELPPRPPLTPRGMAHSGEWVHPIALTLEELFTGKHCNFGITRYYASGRSKNVVIEIDIPTGCRPGTRILCHNIGHEWKPNCFQDIAFVIEERPHDRFVRLFDDLIMDVRVPWVDSLKRQGGKVPFVGIDGRDLVVQIDYPRDKNMKGRSIIKGAGMPIRVGGQIVGRGNMVVQWEILPPKTKILHFIKQLWGFGFKR